MFSISVTVRDLAVSGDVYEKLGFEHTGGDSRQNDLIMKNGDTVAGLVHGMFEKNMLALNPGPTIDGKPLDELADVRQIERALVGRGMVIEQGTWEARDSGPAHMVLEDPDGNPILIDQFFRG